MSTLRHYREHSSYTRPITLDVPRRVSRHHINHPIFSYATISTRHLQSISPILDDVLETYGTACQVTDPKRSGPSTRSRINLRIFEMCGSSTQHWCRTTNSSLHQSTSPHRPTSNPDFISLRSQGREFIRRSDRPSHKYLNRLLVRNTEP